MPKHALKIVPILALTLFVVGGCAWLQEPLDPTVVMAVDDAEALRIDIEYRMDSLQDAIEAFGDDEKQLTTEEKAALAQMQAMLEDLQTSMGSVEAWLAQAQQIVDESPTNEDALLNGASTLGAAFGIPFVALGVGLYRKMKESGNLKLAIGNLENRRDDKGNVDWDALKIDNADAGLNSLLREIRNNGAG